MNNDPHNHSNTDNEFFHHKERKDGTRDLFYGPKGKDKHNHAVIDENGNVKFLREDGQIKTN